MKFAFSLARSSQGNNPNDFIARSGHQGFACGEVAEPGAVPRPLFAEYGSDHPAVYALALLPACDALARVKVHGHWQSNVLAELPLSSPAASIRTTARRR